MSRPRRSTSAAAALARLSAHAVVDARGDLRGWAASSRAPSRAAAGRALALFLGSNIGNFDPPGAEAFAARRFAPRSRAGDALLLGTDLVKPERDLLLAYDDPLGVTAAFNRNLLVRINRELGADFDLDGFAHRAVWNARRVASRDAPREHAARSACAFPARTSNDVRAGETIWTESSYKYEPQQVTAMLEHCGFSLSQQWVDEPVRFALSYTVAV